MATTQSQLDRYTARRAELASALPSGKLECRACAHRCKLADGKRGVCLVRFRDGDALRVPWGYVAGVAVDPIEKKPFFHVRPGSRALSFGMLGCDLHCAYCQNWLTSQALRDPRSVTRAHPTTPEDLVRTAVESGSSALVSTYNEPLITAEWAHDVFALAHERGLLTGLVSNGHGTPEVLDLLAPVTDLMKIDLKAFTPEAYRALGGSLQAVKETIASARALGLWVEVVTLLVPGFNDDESEVAGMAEFLASVSADLPWHLTAFHPDYEMVDRPATPGSALAAARRRGIAAGLRYVYVGNRPGAMSGAEDTRCPGCDALLVARSGFAVRSARITAGGACPECGAGVAGRW